MSQKIKNKNNVHQKVDSPPIVSFAQLGQVPYLQAYQLQKELLTLRQQQQIPDIILLLEHPATLTIGKSGTESNILLDQTELKHQAVTVYTTDRGGDVTGHNPGQLVVYPILDLHCYFRDVPRYISLLEESIIRTIAVFGLTGHRKKRFPGVWVEQEKIAAIGVRLSRWVTMHGFALNVNNDLSIFKSIHPCGIENCAITSIRHQLGRTVPMKVVIKEFRLCFETCFGVQLHPLSAHNAPDYTPSLARLVQPDPE
ncbi:lipoyl(octanoyl) transferase LipB [candidate division CSSED10-310 bacterium]|uniref:Octanoyltransferase n=1 Tax=candidate division CSSED10-310 bacterium TaxID=2855610 RepID=A0ABV6YW47_UNCC1